MRAPRRRHLLGVAPVVALLVLLAGCGAPAANPVRTVVPEPPEVSQPPPPSAETHAVGMQPRAPPQAPTSTQPAPSPEPGRCGEEDEEEEDEDECRDGLLGLLKCKKRGHERRCR